VNNHQKTACPSVANSIALDSAIPSTHATNDMVKNMSRNMFDDVLVVTGRLQTCQGGVCPLEAHQLKLPAVDSVSGYSKC
jgi:hypothetical protein